MKFGSYSVLSLFAVDTAFGNLLIVPATIHYAMRKRSAVQNVVEAEIVSTCYDMRSVDTAMRDLVNIHVFAVSICVCCWRVIEFTSSIFNRSSKPARVINTVRRTNSGNGNVIDVLHFPILVFMRRFVSLIDISCVYHRIRGRSVDSTKNHSEMRNIRWNRRSI